MMKIEVIFLIEQCHLKQKKKYSNLTWKNNTPRSTQNLKGAWQSTLLILFSVKTIAMH